MTSRARSWSRSHTARLVPSRAREPAARRRPILSFLQHAQLDDGRFHNFMAYDRHLARRDRHARQLRARDMGARLRRRQRADANRGGASARTLLDRALPSLESLEYLRSRAYAVLGLAHALRRRARARIRVGARAIWPTSSWLRYEATRGRRLALVRGHHDLRQRAASRKRCSAPARRSAMPRYGDAGLATLEFYESVTHRERNPRADRKRRLVSARRPARALRAAAARSLRDGRRGAGRLRSHRRCRPFCRPRSLRWSGIYGKNSRGIAMAHGGGCYDGLGEDDVNLNMGAESTLAFLAAACAMAQRRARVLRAVR